MSRSTQPGSGGGYWRNGKLVPLKLGEVGEEQECEGNDIMKELL